MSRGNYTGRDVVCPYWREEDATSICCEGWMEKTTVRIRFADKRSKAVFAARRCADMDGYKRCPMAKAAEEKWMRADERTSEA